MVEYELFQQQTVSIMTLLTETAREEIQKVLDCECPVTSQTIEMNERQRKRAKLTAVMESFTKVAVQKICRLYRYCCATKQTQLEAFKKTTESINTQTVIDVPDYVEVDVTLSMSPERPDLSPEENVQQQDPVNGWQVLSDAKEKPMPKVVTEESQSMGYVSILQLISSGGCDHHTESVCSFRGLCTTTKNSTKSPSVAAPLSIHSFQQKGDLLIHNLGFSHILEETFS
ncbi:uncharacterized protein LOC127429773 isoform X5 [Myxocyprinus asiaticus]|uniref:uncharacterized protein LOC127429773 isoform X5 n=1 Tax=Myxocyprinus asiaticus TaxID=70543 RepID=UPI002222611A|nr:uncharacterized protein LOC127429773 isoform X5 [Myxocyprinus asiaticus]